MSPVNSKKPAQHKLRLLAYLLIFHLSFSLTFIIIFGSEFGYGRRMMLLHLLLILGIACLVMVILAWMASLSLFKNSIVTRLVISIIPAVCFTLLVVLYVANFVSNRWWFDNLSYEIAMNQFSYLSSYLRSVNVSPTLVYLSTALGVVLIFVVYFKLSRALLDSLQELRLIWQDHRSFRQRKRIGAILLASVVVIAYVVSVAGVLRSMRATRSIQREPLLAFFVPSFYAANDVDAAALEDQRIRKRYSEPRNFEKQNVVIIIADALRADHTGVYGYERETTPFLSELLRNGQLKKVNLAAANCPFTTCGILSTLTSKSVEQLRFQTSNLRLYDLLFDQGYKVYLILSGDHRSWKYLKESYGSSLNLYFDGLSSTRFGINDDRLLLEGLEKVTDYQGTPAFFYFHLMSTHGLGHRLTEYQKFVPAVDASYVRLFQKAEPEVLRNAYDNQVLQVDGMIQRLLEALERKGYLENSLVFILADHGESLGEHNEFGHGTSLYQEQIGIPLLIIDKSTKVYQNLDFATQLDVAPTILDRLGLPIPATWEGQSLLAANRNEFTHHRTYTKRRLKRAVIYRTNNAIYKYIYSETDGEEELYDLMSDRQERHNLITDADSELVDQIRQRMSEHRVKFPHGR
jgi:glucan phosphoethanolaminetransferase (alkaline phosphatase superfamily)